MFEIIKLTTMPDGTFEELESDKKWMPVPRCETCAHAQFGSDPMCMSLGIPITERLWLRPVEGESRMTPEREQEIRDDPDHADWEAVGELLEVIDKLRAEIDKLRSPLAELKLTERGTDNGWIDDAAVENARLRVLKVARNLTERIDHDEHRRLGDEGR
jgi:hypothetical protein